MVNSESIDSVYMVSLQAMKVDCSLGILKIILHLSLTRCASMMITMMRVMMMMTTMTIVMMTIMVEMMMMMMMIMLSDDCGYNHGHHH